MENINLDKSNLNWLEKQTILLAPTGSYAYGTNTEESDRDYKGVCIPPIEYYLGLESFNEYNTTGGKNFKNTKDDVDVSIIHINKFVKDAMRGVPNNIEILFVREKDFIKVTDSGQRLIENRELFLSKQIVKPFGGYATSQAKKLKTKKVGRQDLIDKYGYDTKMASHTIRLLTSAIEILSTGSFSTYRTDRERLISIKNGNFTFDEVLEMIEFFDATLGVVAAKSGLPDKPDHGKINSLLIDINEEALGFS